MRLRSVWRRPAVSAITRSAPLAAADSTASYTTEAGSAPSAPCTIVGSRALRPHGELIRRGRPEGVAGGQHHMGSRFDPLPGQLADGGGLACSVDA